MANRSRTERLRDIRRAAAIFVTQTRDAKAIGRIMETSETTIHRWSKDPTWNETLDFLGFEGEVSFRVNPRRGR